MMDGRVRFIPVYRCSRADMRLGRLEWRVACLGSRNPL